MRYCEKKHIHIKEVIVAADYVGKKNYASWIMLKVINCRKKKEKKKLIDF